MVAVVLSSAVLGVESYLVKVETDLANGLPGMTIVGLPDGAVRESRDRISAALRNSGYAVPPKRITVNMAPADVRKEGSSYDLAIALSILCASDQISPGSASDTIILGEVSLEGGLRPVRGAVATAADAVKNGVKALIVPKENAEEAAVVKDVEVYGVGSLSEAAQIFNDRSKFQRTQVDLDHLFDVSRQSQLDMRDVRGQDLAKRALEVAAAGGHNVLMVGPPGSGKTMLAKRVPSILPQMTLEESLETTKIHSIAGSLPPDSPLVTQRPFREPHHSTSMAGLIGGGRVPSPGEISLSHNGVLFLDELPEYSRDALEALRQPLENGSASISRAWGSLTFPARSMVVAAMNPCPCGFYGDLTRECRCSSSMVGRYRSRISGPLLDRIDIHVSAPAVPYEDLRSPADAEPSARSRERVQRARDIQRYRFQDSAVYCNAMMDSRQTRSVCQLSGGAEQFLAQALTRLNMSARGYNQILKVARTIADLAMGQEALDEADGGERDLSPCIEAAHISEAVNLRSLDRAYLG